LEYDQCHGTGYG